MRSIYDVLNDIGDDSEIKDVVGIVEESTARISAVDDLLVEVIRENNEFYDEDEFEKKTIKELHEHIQWIADQLANVKDTLY